MQPILKINLNTQKIDDYIIPEDWEWDYLGGASLAARILYDSITPDLDPLSPEAPLLFMNGPLSGTAGRLGILDCGSLENPKNQHSYGSRMVG